MKLQDRFISSYSCRCCQDSSKSLLDSLLTQFICFLLSSLIQFNHPSIHLSNPPISRSLWMFLIIHCDESQRERHTFRVKFIENCRMFLFGCNIKIYFFWIFCNVIVYSRCRYRSRISYIIQLASVTDGAYSATTIQNYDEDVEIHVFHFLENILLSKIDDDSKL